ncbi:MAG: ABC transporter permease [Blastopirellula sp.]|nr:MAG: ABC transporter permease [Blastopirellula sp.]
MDLSFILDFFIGIAPLIIFDLIFTGVFFAVLIPLLLFKQAAYAVLKRNFKAYFSNPTGYVFLALFVLLTSMSAFWPHEFFNANLANLDQLNSSISLIMLIFIPAITMSLWADEKRQGTDELLLTLPATDFDIVMGKYLAAVSVFSVTLLFSQFCNFMVLYSLSVGTFDVGLFCTTYVGYWFMGLAMISLGMVASFLTNNLTLGFIMGIIINAPFVLLEYSNAIVIGSSTTQFLTQASIGMQFADFGRGVISVSSLVYFLMLTAVGIYLSMVLIGRRHWLGGKDGESLFMHYIVRTFALLTVAGASTLIFVMNDYRQDYTANGTSSLSPDTIKLVRNLKTDKPIRIEAFISQNIPKSHAQVKVDLINYLNEFRGISGTRIDVLIYDGLEPFSEMVEKAREEYGIQPRLMVSTVRGAIRQEEVIMGAAIQCGLEKVIIPFFDNGIPVEYELVRSLCTVTDQTRKRVGILQTDAQMFGGIQQSQLGGWTSIPRQAILDELEKQFDVTEVDPSAAIDLDAFDVLMAVQPSSLTQPQLDNLITAIRDGMPVAIFDDPLPMAIPHATPISQPKRPASAMAGMQRPPEQKCNIQKLWDLIGVAMVGEKPLTEPYYDPRIIWQDYNPYPKFRGLGSITHEWVFIDADMPMFGGGAKGSTKVNTTSQIETLRKSPFIPKDGIPITPGMENITNELKQLLFLFPGSVQKKKSAPNSLNFIPLATTSNATGTLKIRELGEAQGRTEIIATKRQPTYENYPISAWIEGTPAAAVDLLEVPQDKGNKKAAGKIKVVFTADIDLLSSMFVQLRAQKDEQNNLRFDNTVFVLNLLDMLSEDDRFVSIRSRSPVISHLKMVDTMTENARTRSTEEIETLAKSFEKERKAKVKEINAPVEKMEAEIAELQQKQRENRITPADVLRFNNMQGNLALQQSNAQKDLQALENRVRKDLEESQKAIQRDLDRQILKTQNGFKLMAVALPPIPPILIGLIVFIVRRLKEREGLSKDRIVK